MSTHPCSGKDNWPMSSKIFITVLVLAIVGPFAYFASQDAVRIKHNLQEQHQQIQKLTTESAQLDKKIGEQKQAKKQAETEVQQLDQQTNDSLLQRQKLEAELGAN